jgi:hypothetical protein
LKDGKQSWETAKSHIKQYGLLQNSSQKGVDERHAIHAPLSPVFYAIDKTNIIAECLEIQFRVHGLCNSDHRRHIDFQIEALLATVDEDIPVNFQHCEVSKGILFLKIGKACGFDGIPKNVSGIFQDDLLSVKHIYSTWPLPGTLEGGKNCNSAETRQRPKFFPKFISDGPLVHYVQTTWEAGFKNNSKTH